MAAYWLFYGGECDDDFNLDFSVKSGPRGCHIGMVNTTLDTQLKKYKILRLHAVIHYAVGYMYEILVLGPGFSYMLPSQLKNCQAGPFTKFKQEKRNMFKVWIYLEHGHFLSSKDHNQFAKNCLHKKF